MLSHTLQNPRSLVSPTNTNCSDIRWISTVHTRRSSTLRFFFMSCQTCSYYQTNTIRDCPCGSLENLRGRKGHAESSGAVCRFTTVLTECGCRFIPAASLLKSVAAAQKTKYISTSATETILRILRTGESALNTSSSSCFPVKKTWTALCVLLQDPVEINPQSICRSIDYKVLAW